MDIDEFFTTKIELLGADDMATVVCNDCRGCTNCCKELSASITLDAWDVSLLKEGLGKSFDQLLCDGSIALKYMDGVLLPVFGNKPDADECVFLGDNGRCSIHPYRAGICRMYPLARLWKGDGSFAYYLQKGECSHLTGELMKVSDWMGYPDVEAYEKAIKEYRVRLKKYRQDCFAANAADLPRLQQAFFNENFRCSVFVPSKCRGCL